MSTKKRVLINIDLTLCLFGLVTLKIIIWRAHDIADIGSILRELREYVMSSALLFLIVPKYGIFLSAFFALVTIWLPAKAKAMFGMIALRISAAMGIIELGAYLFFHILVLLINKSFPYIGLDPLLTAGVIAVIYFAAATSDGFDIVKSKKNENKSQWIFFSHKEKTISAKRKQWGLTSKSRAELYDVPDQKPVRINIEKLGKRLFAASVAAVVVPAICITTFIGSYTTVGRILFVCALIGAPCLFISSTMLIVDFIRKR